MMNKTETLRGYARLAPVIPVVTIEDARLSIDLAQTLVEAGLPVVEVTLRTPAALDAIAAIAKAVPDAVVAAGTVLHPSQIKEVADAGAKFIVTPGTPLRLAEALAEAPIPVMPGCSTVSEAMGLSSLGFEALKFFPAMASGGAAWLKGVQGPLPKLGFCPTGGVDLANAPSLLALSNVLCVGGTWMAPQAALKAGDFKTIGTLAREAAALRPRRD
ncbi:bifunctional 4-hydroxy-2-oxoglutarate aldolase/2-dehydro-3-deoxy-phosphogluconate aldolase [Microvirga pudoricolor]|uniref:bifunctional 4-hydroxy-2-oxoglutarate aldolase/2-dehydro-3-deoxy-phosphogluconate aldolase n=1 Tax=Microvirga pudoricolor TaxID=2778729 RepID=UPI00195239C7|nr:bifunctional 4-hydroxy-2-oxoglutarate aldolase/2-dehydro-3-deoxy-phosphogluconate aldolase [Microvirga pudoricolor]MBM6594873.1 bifunctional 4-hydroxy-2-oxoglutarate aldolase/2-dehydro-3-deoxy-phosphogluconate aldolase [Microvirga pudoricolor]